MKYTLSKEQLIRWFGAAYRLGELSERTPESQKEYDKYLTHNFDKIYSNIIAQSWSKDDEND